MELASQNSTENFPWLFKGQFPTVDQWFLMSTPIPIFIIWMSYLTFVLKLGPEFMKKRPPLNLNSLLVAYNIAQVAFSTYLFCLGGKFILQHGLLYSVCLMDREDTRQYIINGYYLYMVAKLSELLDTIFFVLRKRDRQVTFLHVYHHSITLLCSWFTLKYEPSESALFLGTINSFVHIIMYAYYGLSAFPNLSKYLWWKKYITSLQLVQFMLIIIQVGVYYCITECPPSPILLYTIILNLVLFLYLFGDFYVKSYKSNQAKINANKENTKLKLEKVH